LFLVPYRMPNSPFYHFWKSRTTISGTPENKTQLLGCMTYPDHIELGASRGPK